MYRIGDKVRVKVACTMIDTTIVATGKGYHIDSFLIPFSSGWILENSEQDMFDFPESSLYMKVWCVSYDDIVKPQEYKRVDV